MPVIEGATVLIYQLFYNLINNSLKFSKADTPSRISISSSTKDNFAEIVISDNGIGLETEYLEQIFNPFARLNAKDQYEGTGLGLALCKKIVERHHGTITASGVRNEGASFTIMLPLKQTGKLV
ncbi:sensor histidine kinase [Flavobacterium sp. 3HN19-14]|uniref:sensor histidine kinase n=1 Tax=Flavobacterium sp. 3HN19-14 TaxID=3448133 RepID=UPI003EE28E42